MPTSKSLPRTLDAWAQQLGKLPLPIEQEQHARIRRIDLLMRYRLEPDDPGERRSDAITVAPTTRFVLTSGYSQEFFGQDLVLTDAANFISKPVPRERHLFFRRTGIRKVSPASQGGWGRC